MDRSTEGTGGESSETRSTGEAVVLERPGAGGAEGVTLSADCAIEEVVRSVVRAGGHASRNIFYEVGASRASNTSSVPWSRAASTEWVTGETARAA